MSRRKILTAILCMMPALAAAEMHVVILEGRGGEDRYTEQFAEQVASIEIAAGALTTKGRIHVFRNGDYSRQSVIDFFVSLEEQMLAGDRLAFFLIGHGSYDEHEYKFNIVGADLTDTDLAEMLASLPASHQLIVNTSSSSGAIVDSLRRDDRTLILATRSGVERHATRFGSYFSAALSSDSADLDKNRIVTAEEAFKFAERQVADYFERNGQLATEHPRIDGGQAPRFGLARLGGQAPAQSDAELRRLVASRDELNSEIEELRLRRESMTANAYQAELLDKMLRLATVEDRIEQREREIVE